MLKLDKSPEKISSLFDGIAPVYDKINALLSLNLHEGWNRGLAASLVPYLKEKNHLLDLCAGTGAITKHLIKLENVEKISLLDVSPGMLALAKASLKDPRLEFVQGDALALPFAPKSFDGITVAYGIRNLPSLEKGFNQAKKVLKPGGVFAILELTRPKGILAPLHKLYLKSFVPLIGRLASHRGEAYDYLANSVADFIPSEMIEEQLKKAGFKPLKIQPLLRGCATLFLSSSA